MFPRGSQPGLFSIRREPAHISRSLKFSVSHPSSQIVAGKRAGPDHPASMLEKPWPRSALRAARAPGNALFDPGLPRSEYRPYHFEAGSSPMAGAPARSMPVEYELRHQAPTLPRRLLRQLGADHPRLWRMAPKPGKRRISDDWTVCFRSASPAEGFTRMKFADLVTKSRRWIK